jgi:hypothetical protein
MLLGGDLSIQCPGEIHDTLRLRIRRPQLFGKKCDPGVVAEILETRSVYSSELTNTSGSVL